MTNNTTGKVTTREQTPCNEPRRKAMKFAPARTSERFNARNLSRLAVSKEHLKNCKITISATHANLAVAQGQTRSANRIEPTKMTVMIILVGIWCPVASNNHLVNENSRNVT